MSEKDRRRRRGAFAVLGLIGLLLTVLGAIAPGLAPDRAPVPVPVGTGVPVPGAGPFGGRVALYGTTASSDRTPSTGLGCTVSGGDGAGTTTRGVDGLDRLVIGERAVLPLLVITRTGDDARLVCTGPEAQDVVPLWLVTTYGVRDLVPMAAWSLAGLALTLGLAGVWQLRPEPVGR